MAAPTDRPLAPVPGQDTRPGIVLLHLYDKGPASARRLSYDLLLPRRTIDATLVQLRDAGFVEPCATGQCITRRGRQYLSWILCVDLRERRTLPGRLMYPPEVSTHGIRI